MLLEIVKPTAASMTLSHSGHLRHTVDEAMLPRLMVLCDMSGGRPFLAPSNMEEWGGGEGGTRWGESPC